MVSMQRQCEEVCSRILVNLIPAVSMALLGFSCLGFFVVGGGYEQGYSIPGETEHHRSFCSRQEGVLSSLCKQNYFLMR